MKLVKGEITFANRFYKILLRLKLNQTHSGADDFARLSSVLPGQVKEVNKELSTQFQV